ncbi:MAG: agmatinase [Planctomycetaceae bacterium]
MSNDLRGTKPFLGLDRSPITEADVIILPLPFEGTVSYGHGTAAGPNAVLRASQEIEVWDEEVDFSLDSLKYHTAALFSPAEGDTTGTYLVRLFGQSKMVTEHPGLLVSIGGEHSITPPVVRGLCESKKIPFSDLTVVQFDAHADLRSEYEGMKQSHACAMRPLVENGARVVGVGIRSVQQDELRYAEESRRVQTFGAQRLADDPDRERELCSTLGNLRGNIYLTIDVDVLEVHLCPGTGTPQPGGLAWWQMLRYLRALLHQNDHCKLVGVDIVETVPMLGTQVNEFVSARLLSKVLAYYFSAKRAEKSE